MIIIPTNFPPHAESALRSYQDLRFWAILVFQVTSDRFVSDNLWISCGLHSPSLKQLSPELGFLIPAARDDASSPWYDDPATVRLLTELVCLAHAAGVDYLDGQVRRADSPAPDGRVTRRQSSVPIWQPGTEKYMKSTGFRCAGE